MTSDDGRKTVSYLVKCALPAGKTLVKADDCGIAGDQKRQHREEGAEEPASAPRVRRRADASALTMRWLSEVGLSGHWRYAEFSSLPFCDHYQNLVNLTR
jgi:hypothetical protein